MFSGWFWGEGLLYVWPLQQYSGDVELEHIYICYSPEQAAQGFSWLSELRYFLKVTEGTQQRQVGVSPVPAVCWPGTGLSLIHCPQLQPGNEANQHSHCTWLCSELILLLTFFSA